MFIGPVHTMASIRTLLMAMMLMAFFSSHAVAYQYGYYSPGRYSASQAYNRPHARIPNPYYPAYRYPVRPAYTQPQLPVPSPGDNRVGIKYHHKSVANIKSSPVEVISKSSNPVAKTGSGLSGKKRNSLQHYCRTLKKRTGV